MNNRLMYLLAAGLLLGGCSQEEQKQREANEAREEAVEAQAEADAERARADAKQVRADAETKAQELEEHADAVEKGGASSTVVTEERKTIRTETTPERRR
jgi:PBP1b-binding outer membrane lipoprotein LpoB